MSAVEYLLTSFIFLLVSYKDKLSDHVLVARLYQFRFDTAFPPHKKLTYSLLNIVDYLMRFWPNFAHLRSWREDSSPES